MQRSIRDRGVLLDSRPSGERHFCTALLEVNGLTRFLYQPSRRRTGPGLFNTASFLLTKTGNSQDFLFLSEFQDEITRAEIGRSYDILESSSALARILIDNGLHFEQPEPVFTLLNRFLDAIAGSPLPRISLLKALYQLAKLEGLPVREDWLDHLPPPQNALATSLLFQPLKDLTDDHPAPPLIISISEWLRKSADWRIE
ncbi:MAG: hypothetical protein ACFCU4_02210 [Puniceicoccaceae bacterium]